MFNFANNLTLARIGVGPAIVVLLAFPNRVFCLAAALLFLAAAATDFVDGFVARRYNLVTTMGRCLDPLADKLLIASTLIMLTGLGWVPAWVSVIVVGRELAVTGLRAVAADEGVVISADAYGKIKTVSQIGALFPLVLHYPWWGFDPRPLGLVILYLATGMTVFSGINYFATFFSGMGRQHSSERDNGRNGE